MSQIHGHERLLRNPEEVAIFNGKVIETSINLNFNDIFLGINLIEIIVNHLIFCFSSLQLSNKLKMINELFVYWEGTILLVLGPFMGTWHRMEKKKIHVFCGLMLMLTLTPSNPRSLDPCMECQWAFTLKKFTMKIRILKIWNGSNQRMYFNITEN